MEMLAKHMSSKGLKVYVVGLFSKQDDYVQRLNLSNLEVSFQPEIGNAIQNYPNAKPWTKLRLWFKLIKWLRSQKAEVIIPYTALVDDFINVVWRFSGARLSLSLERGGHSQPKREKRSWLKRIKKISKPIYVANSRHGAKAMSIIRGIDESHIRVIRNGFTPNQLENTTPTSIDGVGDASIVFLMIANYFDQKDHQFLLRAWKEAQLERGRLVIIGLGGSDTCKKNYAAAKTFIQTHGLEKQVFLLGAIRNIIPYLKRADVGLLSSTTEGCPNAVLEYMGAGLPVIARDIPGVREVLSIENQSFLADFEDHEDYAKKLKIFESDVELRRRLGLANQEHVLKEFSVKDMVDAYEEILL